MTAQGGDILAWLKGAIASREQTAFDALNYERGAAWAANGCTVEVVGGLAPYGDVFEETVVFAEGSPTEEQAKHIAANDPEVVLRRCAADRKLLEIHAPMEDPEVVGRDHLHCRQCAAPVIGELDNVPFPCATVRAVAEGYGCTEGER